MAGWVALLRAVNVGGIKVLMEDLRTLAQREGFADARTYIASGNLILQSDLAEAEIAAKLEAALAKRYGRPMGVIVRSGAALAKVVADNPFADQPGNKLAALFTDRAVTLDGVRRAEAGEQVVAGEGVLYIWYPEGMGRSKLVVPAGRDGTARNMNTVARLAELAAD